MALKVYQRRKTKMKTGQFKVYQRRKMKKKAGQGRLNELSLMTLLPNPRIVYVYRRKRKLKLVSHQPVLELEEVPSSSPMTSHGSNSSVHEDESVPTTSTMIPRTPPKGLEKYLVRNWSTRNRVTRPRKALVFSIYSLNPHSLLGCKKNKRSKRTRPRNMKRDGVDFQIMFLACKFTCLSIAPPPEYVSTVTNSKRKAKKEPPLIAFDESTFRQLDRMEKQKNVLLLCNGENENEDEEWTEERDLFRGRVDVFISTMHLILGNRKFRMWKGSVLDSIVGVFLTQNVSDHLSSNAYMHLAAKFPLPTHHNLHRQPITMPLLALTQGEEEVQVEEETSENPEPEALLGVESQTALVLPSTVSKSNKLGKAKRKKKEEKSSAEDLDWQDLRRRYSSPGPRSVDRMDSVDWDAVRRAEPKQVEDAIRERGQHTILAGRIQECLNLIHTKLEGSYDMEWLRTAPQETAKELLRGIYGLGLKSVECVRLLCLQHIAFPVDVNVARITVRLGWVPLKPLPGDIQFHALEEFPLMDKVQMYLWPRLCTLDHETLYELHYHLITFGKAICTKRKPNCKVCPLKGQCLYYSSLVASGRRPALPPPEGTNNSPQTSCADITGTVMEVGSSSSTTEEPIIEFPESPERDNVEDYAAELEDMEDYSPAEIEVEDSLIPLSHEPDYDMPMPKLKDVYTLKTVHLVIELPEDHPVLRKLNFPRRDSNEEFPYLFAPWTPGETESSTETPTGRCTFNTKEGTLCNKSTCHYCNKVRDMRARRLWGTILIPCRTAMNGAFPLNGTYFQVNEVFADDYTSKTPICVSYDSVRNCKHALVYFGSMTSGIFKGLSEEKMRACFDKGYVCLRGFDRETRRPETLVHRFHLPPSKKASLKKEERAKKAKGKAPNFSEDYDNLLRLLSSKPSQ